jgi:hypothetical protein
MRLWLLNISLNQSNANYTFVLNKIYPVTSYVGIKLYQFICKAHWQTNYLLCLVNWPDASDFYVLKALLCSANVSLHSPYRLLPFSNIMKKLITYWWTHCCCWRYPCITSASKCISWRKGILRRTRYPCGCPLPSTITSSPIFHN